MQIGFVTGKATAVTRVLAGQGVWEDMGHFIDACSDSCKDAGRVVAIQYLEQLAGVE